MAHFLDNYEDVNSRIKRFKDLHKNHRIITQVENFQPENGWVLVRADIYVDGILVASDYAFGDRETYPANMKKWYVEDTSTSAVGRAIALVIDVDHKATKQNMSRVETVKVENPSDPWTIIEKPAPKKMDTDSIAASLNAEVIPECKHGPMTLKEGSKNGRAYHGYTCKMGGIGPGEQCKAIWYELTPSGKWMPPKPKE